MSGNSRNGGMRKVFEHFSKMPNEIKLMMVKEMELRDRFRFSRCSKSSWNFWAKVTRNQPCSLSVYVGEQRMTIEIKHGDHEMFGGEDGFRLVFNKGMGIVEKKYIRYETLWFKELWNTQVNKDIDVIQLGVQHLNKAFKFYQNGITEMLMTGSFLKDIWMNLDIENFKNLEVLYVYGCVEIMHLILPNVRHPLKMLNVFWMPYSTNHKNCDQLFQVQDQLTWTHTNFNYHEFLQLSAKHVHIKIGKLTEQEIFNFIKSWENGTYKGRIEKCEWSLVDSRFDKRLLCQLFQKIYSIYSEKTIRLEQKGSGKFAVLLIRPFQIEFAINSQ